MTRIRILTLEQRDAARKLREAKVPLKVIARQFGVSPQTICWHVYPRIRETERARRATRC